MISELRDAFLDVEAMIVTFPLLWQGLLFSARVWILIVPLGILLGLVLGINAASPSWPARIAGLGVIDFFRCFPPLVLLIVVVYALPFLGVRLDPFVSAVLALALTGGAYFGEIFRGAIRSVPRGQWEGAAALGLRRQQVLRLVVLPQALRQVVGPVLGNSLELMKATAICSAVALPDLLRNAQTAQGIVFKPAPLVLAAAIYLAIFLPIVWLVSRYEPKPGRAFEAARRGD